MIKLKKARKSIALLLMVVYITGLFPALTGFAQEGLTDADKAILRLTGVYDESLSFDTILTRGEFVNLISGAIFSTGEDMTSYKSQRTLTDVDEFVECFDAVNAMSALGFIIPDKYGRFFPDEHISYADAVRIIARALGYTDEMVESKWKTPERFSISKKLSKRISLTSDGKVNVYSAYVLISNMLSCDISDLFDGNEKIIYMTYKHDIYDIDGMVNHDGIVSLDYSRNIKSNEIIIGNEIFVNESGKKDLFGQKINGYYRHSRTDSKKVLLSVYGVSQDAKIITLHSEDIGSFANRTYTYRSGDLVSSVSRKYVPAGATIIYNEKKLGLSDPFTDDMFIPANGRVRLYMNGNKVEIVRIEDFSVGIVNAVNADTKKIYIEGSRIVDLSDCDYSIEDKYGSLVELGDIIKNNVVSYLFSFDGKIAKVVVADESYSDIVKEYQNVGNGIITTESGARYELSKHAKDSYDKPEIDGSYIFYFDAFDMLAGIVKDSAGNDNIYGLIAAKKSEGSLSSKYMIRMYTTTGDMQDYYLNEKVKILDENDSEKYWTAEEIYTDLSYTGLVRYKLNSDGKISYIEIPLEYGKVPDRVDRMYYLLDTYEHGNKEDYQTFPSNGVVNVSGEAIITSGTIVFQRPDNALDFEDYAIGSINSFSQYGKYSMFVIGTDYRKKKADAVVMYQALTYEISSQYPYVIKRIVKTYDHKKDRVAYKLDLIEVNAFESSYYMEEDVYETGVLAIAEGCSEPIKLQAGDWIYFVADGEYILRATCPYDSDYVVEDEEGNLITGAIAGTKYSYLVPEDVLRENGITDENEISKLLSLTNPFIIANQGIQNPGKRSDATNFYPSRCKIFTGWVYSCEDGYIQITNQNPAYGMDLSKGINDGVVSQIYVHNRGVYTEIDDKGNATVRALTDADVRSYLEYGADCSRVVYAQYQYARRCINVINIE